MQDSNLRRTVLETDIIAARPMTLVLAVLPMQTVRVQVLRGACADNKSLDVLLVLDFPTECEHLEIDYRSCDQRDDSCVRNSLGVDVLHVAPDCWMKVAHVLLFKMAEDVGFEPTVAITGYFGFQDRCLNPLSQSSGKNFMAEGPGFEPGVGP